MSVGLLDAPKMAKKRGRPDKGRNDVTAKIDAEVMRKAKTVANLEGKSIAEYLSDLLAPVVDRDLKRKMGKLFGPEKGDS